MPEKFKERLFYQHNATVTLMRTTAEECAAIGRDIVEKVAASKGPAAIYLPLGGVSAIDEAGQPFEALEAREALFNVVRKNHGDVELVEMPQHINDPRFAEVTARRLIEMIEQKQE